jgi:hypothetical protein
VRGNTTAPAQQYDNFGDSQYAAEQCLYEYCRVDLSGLQLPAHCNQAQQPKSDQHHRAGRGFGYDYHGTSDIVDVVAKVDFEQFNFNVAMAVAMALDWRD